MRAARGQKEEDKLDQAQEVGPLSVQREFSEATASFALVYIFLATAGSVCVCMVIGYRKTGLVEIAPAKHCSITPDGALFSHGYPKALARPTYNRNRHACTHN